MKPALVSWTELHLMLEGVCREESFHVGFKFSTPSSPWEASVVGLRTIGLLLEALLHHPMRPAAAQ